MKKLKNQIILGLGVIALTGSMMLFSTNSNAQEPITAGECYFNEICDFVGKGACAFCEH